MFVAEAEEFIHNLREQSVLLTAGGANGFVNVDHGEEEEDAVLSAIEGVAVTEECCSCHSKKNLVH